ncbi:MAG TPA: macro domain-containing protein [Pyrinomonadaceae bacterium]|jgi:hypothetical protein
MWKRRIKFLLARESLKSLASHFFAALGALWLLFELYRLFWGDVQGNSRKVLFVFFILGSLAWALRQAFPPLHYSKRSRAPVEIEIKVGDLFAEPGNIAVGCNDCFDTDYPQVIGRNSLIAQLSERLFTGRRAELDERIEQALAGQGAPDEAKLFGKNRRYQTGTVAVVEQGGRKLFLSAFSRLQPDRTSTITKEDLLASLSNLWAAVRQHGKNDEPLALPVWGSGLAGFHASRISLIQLLLLFFVIATRERIVTRKLTLVIYEGDYDPKEFNEAIQLIDTLDF